MTSVMRPGRGLMTTILVERYTASGMECVTKPMVLPVRDPEFQKLLVEMVADDLVQCTEGLIHQQDIGIKGQRAGNGGALLHATGELPWETSCQSRRGRRASKRFSTRLFLFGMRVKPMISRGSLMLLAIVRQG